MQCNRCLLFSFLVFVLWISPRSIVLAKNQRPTALDFQKEHPSHSQVSAEFFSNLLRLEPYPQQAQLGRLPRQVHVNRGLFASSDKLTSLGVLKFSVADKLMLNDGDTFFIEVPAGSSLKKGDKLDIYRYLGEIRHPLKKKREGYMIEVTGRAEIIEQKDRLLKAVIQKIWWEIERGQEVKLYSPYPIETVSYQHTDKTIVATILANESYLVVVGQEKRLFMDKGSLDGVQLGNIFKLKSQNDNITQKKNLSASDDVVLMVIDVQPHLATCLVLQAKIELEPGMQISTEKSF